MLNPPARLPACPPARLPACPPARPLISVILPTYNAAAVVTECLQSLAEQTFRDFELVVADGASTDETVAIVESFAPRLPRLTLDSCPDRGIYDAMNRAWSRAAGRWLYFIGADDTLRSVDTLQLAAQHLSEGFDVVYGDIVRCTTGRREGGVFDLARLATRTLCHQGVFYRREFIDAVGPYDLRFPLNSDWEFNLRCFGRGAVTRHMDVVVANYSGTGRSAYTDDTAFLQDKYSLITRLYGCSLLDPVLAACRWDFRSRAGRHFGNREWLAGLRYAALFAVHSLRAKTARKPAHAAG